MEVETMLRKSQIAALTLLAAIMWAGVTYRIKHNPNPGETRELMRFLLAPVGGVISVWLCKVVGRLRDEQLLAGTALVGGIAMALDGAALRWFHGLYGFNEQVLRVAAAGLLWGYGVAFLIAIVWVSVATRKHPGLS
jgi:hypothetical protein